MKDYAIALVPSEQSLLESLEFDVLKLDHDTFPGNAQTAHSLIRSLLARGAIPDHRKRWFTDPDYRVSGRRRSRQQDFERNGCHGDEILTHPHFLPHLRYFVFGPRLPRLVIHRFAEVMAGCGMITSGDIVPLGKQARQLAREFGLEKHAASDEFFKLALEQGATPGTAASIGRAVLQLR